MISKRMDLIETSGIRKIFELVQNMTDAVDLSLGQAHFDIPDPIKEASFEAIKHGYNNYTVSKGLPEVHEALRTHLHERHQYHPEEILLTNGATGGLFLAMMALINEGDEVLVPDPCFVLYKHLIALSGGTTVFVDTYPEFRLTVDVLEKHVTDKTKVLLFNNPVNPTGIAYAEHEIQAIAQFAKNHDLVIISDEVYDNFTYDFNHTSMVTHYDNTVLINAFSKTYAMPGWRIGYATGPNEILQHMTTLQQCVYVCAPAPAQKTVSFALNYDMSPFIAEYKHKRDLIYEGLSECYEMDKTEGAFYAFPRVPFGTDTEFLNRAIAHNLLIVPGGVFSERKTHFRISFAATDENIKRGIDILRKIAEEEK